LVAIEKANPFELRQQKQTIEKENGFKQGCCIAFHHHDRFVGILVWVVGAIHDRFCVFSVTEPKRAVITFSLGAVSVVGFGLKSWPIVPFSMCLWIGKI
jgi:hypothetical protein